MKRKNLNKRFLALALALVMALALVPTAALAADSEFTIENGVLTGYSGLGGDVVIPDGVTSIGDNVFSGNTNVTGVTIPNTVTSIGEGAFRGTELTSVTIPNSVTSIGPWAFGACNNLTSIAIPASVTSIANHTFDYCLNLTSVSIPNTVTKIGYAAFNGCGSLTSAVIPNGVTSIESNTFASCTSLTSVTIPGSVTSFGELSFLNCTSLKDVYFGGTKAQWEAFIFDSYYDEPLIKATIHYGATASTANSDFTIENGVLTKYNGAGGAVTIPDGVSSIGDSVFQGNTSVTSVTIPNGVTSIGKFAFQNCSNLTSVTFPNSLIAIKERAFYCCASLTDMILPSGIQSIESCAFFDCVSLKELVIPNSVTHLGERSFQGCKSMTRVTFEPGGADLTLTHGTFAHCANMAEMNLSDRITIIGGVDEGYWGSGYVFVNSPELHSIVIPKSVKQIYTHCFGDCTGLTSVTILNPSTQIDNYAFINTNVKDVYYVGTETQWKELKIDSAGNSKLLSATIHYNSTGPATPSVPDLGEASIQESAIQKTGSAAEWVERLELPQYGETLYNVISGTDEKRGAFEEEKNFTLPQASTGPAVSQVDKIEAAEFSLLDLYANPGAELDSAIFSTESFYEIPANTEDQKIDFKNLTMGDFVTTANYNGVYVTKIPYDSAFDTKKTEACEYIAAVFHAFDRDHPEVFWLSGKCKARIMVTTDPATKAKEAYFFLVLADKDGFTMRAPAWTAAGSIEAGIARRDAAVDGILKTVNAGTVAGRIKQLNQWITEHNQYNTTENLTSISNEPHECLAALEGRIGTDGPVCDGYSRAFKVLCDKLGIPCVLETGYARPTTSSAGEFHMWSLVQVNGAWYGADITWDDPSVKGFVGAKSGRENEKYLLVGAETVIDGMTFGQSHVVKNQAAVGGVDFNNGPVMGTQAYTGLPALPATASALPTNDKLSVDGVSKSPAAYKIGGANYFKLRDVAMLLNGTKAQFNIRYDDAKRAINITTGQTYEPQGYELQPMPAGSATANLSNDAVYIDGVQVDLAAYKIGGANFYGIRDLGRRLGFNVGWKQGTGMYIESDKPYSDAD